MCSLYIVRKLNDVEFVNQAECQQMRLAFGCHFPLTSLCEYHGYPRSLHKHRRRTVAADLKLFGAHKKSGTTADQAVVAKEPLCNLPTRFMKSYNRMNMAGMSMRRMKAKITENIAYLDQIWSPFIGRVKVCSKIQKQCPKLAKECTVFSDQVQQKLVQAHLEAFEDYIAEAETIDFRIQYMVEHFQHAAEKMGLKLPMITLPKQKKSSLKRNISNKPSVKFEPKSEFDTEDFDEEDDDDDDDVDDDARNDRSDEATLSPPAVSTPPDDTDALHALLAATNTNVEALETSFGAPQRESPPLWYAPELSMKALIKHSSKKMSLKALQKAERELLCGPMNLELFASNFACMSQSFCNLHSNKLVIYLPNFYATDQVWFIGGTHKGLVMIMVQPIQMPPNPFLKVIDLTSLESWGALQVHVWWNLFAGLMNIALRQFYTFNMLSPDVRPDFWQKLYAHLPWNALDKLLKGMECYWFPAIPKSFSVTPEQLDTTFDFLHKLMRDNAQQATKADNECAASVNWLSDHPDKKLPNPESSRMKRISAALSKKKNLTEQQRAALIKSCQFQFEHSPSNLPLVVPLFNCTALYRHWENRWIGCQKTKAKLTHTHKIRKECYTVLQRFSKLVQSMKSNNEVVHPPLGQLIAEEKYTQSKTQSRKRKAIHSADSSEASITKKSRTNQPTKR